MYQRQSFKQILEFTPKIVKWTIFAILGITLFGLLSQALFTKLFGLPTLQEILSLSTWGIKHFFLWQLITYALIQPMAIVGVEFGTIIRLLFDTYLLWAIGSSIIGSRGQKHFIGLFFGGTLFIGLIACLALLFSGSPVPFVGPSFPIYILLIGWVFLIPYARIMLFMLIPMQAKWLVFGLLGINLFIDLSNGNFFSFLTTFGTLLYGYSYAVLVWESLSPFPLLHNFEKKLIFLKRKLFSPLRRRPKVEVQGSNIHKYRKYRD